MDHDKFVKDSIRKGPEIPETAFMTQEVPSTTIFLKQHSILC